MTIRGHHSTFMSAALVRLALLQFVVVVCSVIACGLTLRMRFGSGSHLPLMATYVRDYGLALLLIPTVWGIWGIIRSNRPLAGAGDADVVVGSGIGLLILLTFFGLIAWMSAVTYHSLVIYIPPTPAPHIGHRVTVDNSD